MTKPFPSFHVQSVDDVLKALDVQRGQGLSKQEVKRRL